jgi:hypothetical protein
MEHVERYHSVMPETTGVLASGIDSHNDLVRYGWKIVDQG